MTLRNGFSDEYKEKKINLESKKEVLYENQDFSKWDIDQDNLPVSKHHIINDKELAKKYMLTKVI